MRRFLFLVFLFLLTPVAVLAQEITVEVPVHPSYQEQHGYDPALAMMTWQGSSNQTGHISEWRDRNGNATCWADFDGHLSCASGGITVPGLINIYHNGTLVGTEPGLNIIDGSNVTLNPFLNNAGASRVDLTINSTGGGGGGCSGLTLPITVFTTASGCTDTFQTQEQSTVFAGPVAVSGTLNDEYVQSNQFAEDHQPDPVPAFNIPVLSPVTAGHTLLLVAECANFYPGTLTWTFTDDLGSTFTRQTAANWGNQFIFGSMWTAPLTASGLDTIHGTVAGCGDDVTQSVSVIPIELTNAGAIDAAGGASDFAGGSPQTVSITTTTNNDELIAVGMTYAGAGSTPIVINSFHTFNTAQTVPNFCTVTNCYNGEIVADANAPVAGSYSVTFTAPARGFLNYASAFFLVAFHPAVNPPPLSAVPYFRNSRLSDLPAQVIPLWGTSGNLGGSALVAGACSSATVAVTGALAGMDAHATPSTYPGDGFYWTAFINAANVVTVRVCAVVAGTPTASVYNVRVVM
jgi:hypothetical protein